MQIIDYFRDSRQDHWLAQIRRTQWRAARLLESLLADGAFHEVLGRGTLYLLTDGDRLVSFLTLAERDCIEDDMMTPWIGFVHTAPEYRGRRCAGQLLEHAVRTAGEHGAKQVYICTDHIGLYEKYGFTYLENRVSIYGEDSRVLVRPTHCPPVTVNRLNIGELETGALDGFIRHQVVRECWRKVAGEWQLLPIAFTEDWDQAKLRAEEQCLTKAAGQGSPVFVARADGNVIGFAALGERLGSQGQYIALESLHVSEPWRGQGVGRALFAAACAAARECHARKLYISAHSSKESQAAYRALGCVEAVEYDAVRADAEPFDVQMEYDLYRPLTFRFGVPEDVPAWMKLVRRVAWNFPGLESEAAIEEHRATVEKFISKGNAICAVEDGRIVGVLLFSRRLNQLACMAVAPEARRKGAAQGMFGLMLTIADPARDITVITFCEDDPKGVAPRAFYRRNGFIPGIVTVEDGHPCQYFIRRAETHA